MKKFMKALLVPVIFSFIIPSLTVFAWGDSSGGRPSYSLQEIYEQAEEFGNTPFFNSIAIAESDYKWYEETFGESLAVGEVTNEKNYVIARESSSTDVEWAANEIIVEDGKTYTIRAYICNNNPHGADATSADTRVWFSIPRTSDTEASVNGFIASGNAFPEEYVDYVTFRSESDETFHLEYVAGSATIISSGAINGSTLSDEVIKTADTEIDGVLIGYDALDGNLPGGRQYACNVDIQVKVVFDHGFLVEQKARVVGRDREWFDDSIEAKVGDIIEFQTQYKNLSEETQHDVAIRDTLPEWLLYVDGSTTLYNGNFPDGMPVESDALIDNGINLGNYSPGANAYVRFRAEVMVLPEEGMINWVQVQAGEDHLVMNDSIVIHRPESDNTTLEIIIIAVGIAALFIIVIIIAALRYSKRHSGDNQTR